MSSAAFHVFARWREHFLNALDDDHPDPSVAVALCAVDVAVGCVSRHIPGHDHKSPGPRFLAIVAHVQSMLGLFEVVLRSSVWQRWCESHLSIVEAISVPNPHGSTREKDTGRDTLVETLSVNLRNLLRKGANMFTREHLRRSVPGIGGPEEGQERADRLAETFSILPILLIAWAQLAEYEHSRSLLTTSFLDSLGYGFVTVPSHVPHSPGGRWEYIIKSCRITIESLRSTPQKTKP